MAQQRNKFKPKPKKLRTLIINVVIVAIIVFLVGRQLMFGQNGQQGNTDTLITSEFVSAVQQDRVKSVVYDAGSYTVSGTYYPAITAGSQISSAFKDSFEALNARSGEQARVHTPAHAPSSASAQAGDNAQVPGVSTSLLDSKQLGTERHYTSTYLGQNSLDALLKSHPQISYEIKLPSPFREILQSVVPVILMGALLFFFLFQVQKAGSSQMGFGKTSARRSIEERPDVSFDDVAGADEAVEEMREVKDFLSNPEKYKELGARIPHGCLLVGPPGTGKTLLARAVAGEAGAPFFSISGSDFVEMFAGVGASRVRDLFKQAKEAAPSIIFIDEIDAVGRKRGGGFGGAHEEADQTLNQLLVEMDGFDKNDSVVLIAATNRADVLDPALLRPGRFDRQILVDAPDVRGREKILKVHAKGKPLGTDVNLKSVATITPGFTGADLMNLLNEAALLTARRGKKVITQSEVSEAMERIVAGPERKGRVMTESTKKTIAYHESGHALVGFSLPLADPVHKISIIARGRALGYTLSIPEEDKVLNTVGEMKAQLAVFMGGRVAEKLFCDDYTTGASNDIERATAMARAMVTQYGMSHVLGNQTFAKPREEAYLGGNACNYSSETVQLIDKEVSRLLDEAYNCALTILKNNAEQMHLMARVLLERETVEGEACKALLENKWDEYVAHEPELEAKREAEEQAARKKDKDVLRKKAADEKRENHTHGKHNRHDGTVIDKLETMLSAEGINVQMKPERPLERDDEDASKAASKTAAPKVAPKAAGKPASTTTKPASAPAEKPTSQSADAADTTPQATEKPLRGTGSTKSDSSKE